MAVGGHFLIEIVDFDGVNATILIVLFTFTCKLTFKKCLTVYFFRKSFVLYVSRLAKIARMLCNRHKNVVNFCTLYIKKKSIIDTGKWSTSPLALQWFFYSVLRTDQYYHNLMNFAHIK